MVIKGYAANQASIPFLFAWKEHEISLPKDEITYLQRWIVLV